MPAAAVANRSPKPAARTAAAAGAARRLRTQAAWNSPMFWTVRKQRLVATARRTIVSARAVLAAPPASIAGIREVVVGPERPPPGPHPPGRAGGARVQI